MAFEAQKEQLKDGISQLTARIQDSSAYNTLREKFEILPSSTQKLLIFGGIGVAVLVAVYIPFSYYQASGDNMESFNSKRQLIKELLQTSTYSQLTASGREPTFELLRSQMNGKIERSDLKPEQAETVMSNNTRSKGMVAAAIKEVGASVTLKTLTVPQILRLGSAFDSIRDAILTDVRVKADPAKAGYFDVTYVVKSFYLPQPDSDDKKNAKPTRGSGSRRTRRNN